MRWPSSRARPGCPASARPSWGDPVFGRGDPASGRAIRLPAGRSGFPWGGSGLQLSDSASHGPAAGARRANTGPVLVTGDHARTTHHIGLSSLKIKIVVKICPAETGYIRTSNESAPVHVLAQCAASRIRAGFE